jgi:hypothetical protein
MLTVFPLAKFSPVGWKDLFLGYNANIHAYGDNVYRIRMIEDGLNKIDLAHNLIATHQKIIVDMNVLNVQEKNYIQYICWLNEIKNRFKFGNKINELPVSFETINPFTKRIEKYREIDTEMYFLYYNLACINYAKGILSLLSTFINACAVINLINQFWI